MFLLLIFHSNVGCERPVERLRTRKEDMIQETATHCPGMMCLPIWGQMCVKKSKVFSRETRENGSGCCESRCSFISSPGFKSQSSPWMKWCPPNCRVHRGSRPLGCPPPTMPGASAPPLQEEAWFSQSRSSRLWRVPYCRERITRSCRSPAETQSHEAVGRGTGNDQQTGFF